MINCNKNIIVSKYILFNKNIYVDIDVNIQNRMYKNKGNMDII